MQQILLYGWRLTDNCCDMSPSWVCGHAFSVVHAFSVAACCRLCKAEKGRKSWQSEQRAMATVMAPAVMAVLARAVLAVSPKAPKVMWQGSIVSQDGCGWQSVRCAVCAHLKVFVMIKVETAQTQIFVWLIASGLSWSFLWL